MRRKLEFQADRIEMSLTQYDAPGKVTGGTVTPRWVRFQVLPAVGTKIAKIKGLSEELAAALGVHDCRVSRRGAAIAIEIPRDDPRPVRLMPLYTQLVESGGKPIPHATAILGLSEDGSPLLIRLPSPDVAHILVAGTTGSGKTVLLQTMITSLAMTNQPRELALVLIDPKRHAFTPFAHLPHLIEPITSDTEKTIDLLSRLVALMEQRGAKAAGDPTIVVVIDELVDLLLTGGKPMQKAIVRLIQRGREAGIHVIAATQKPTSALLGPLVKANFPVRLVGRVTSAEDARTATGWSGTGAERLTGQGDFIAIAEGRVQRFQAAHVTRDEIENAIQKTITRKLPPGDRQPPTAQIHLPPMPKPDPNPDLRLAERLIEWREWSQRHNPADASKYHWGFQSKACKFLFDKDLAGTWSRRLKRILALAEQISSTTTTPETPKIELKPTAPRSNDSSSRSSTLLHTEKSSTALTLKPMRAYPITRTDTDLLILTTISFCAGAGSLLIAMGVQL